MSQRRDSWAAAAPYLKDVLRIVTALVFMTAGSTILFGFPTAMPEGSTAPLWSQVWIGGLLEFFGGALVALGLFTRPVSFILAGMMAVAYFQFHFPSSFWPSVNNGVPAILDCFIFLYLSAAGAGPLSLDAVLLRKRKPAPG